MITSSSPRRNVFAFSFLVALVVGAVGCSGSVGPTAPATDQPGFGPAGFGAQSTSAISGQLLTSGVPSAAGSGSSPQSASASGIQVSIDGTDLVTSADESGKFLLIGVPSGDVRMRFVGNGANADLMVPGIAADEIVQLTIQVLSTSAQVVSENRDHTDQFEGLLSEVDPVAGSFTLAGGPTIHVDPDTWWDSGGDIQSFEGLVIAAQRGQVVELEGRFITTPAARQLATVVKAEIDDAELEVEGFAVAVDRGTMSITFVDGTVVVIDLLTTWDPEGDYFAFDALATAIEAGMFVEVEVEGSLLDGGAVSASHIKAEDDPFELEFKPDEWDVDWVGSGSSGKGGSAVDARIEDGPYADILPSSVEMEGPSGVVTPVATEFEDGRFTAAFTKADAIGIVAGLPVGSSAPITVRGTLTDGTPWELIGTIEVVEDDDGEDGEEGANKIDPAIAAQAIADIGEVIDLIEGLVDAGDLAANNAGPLISKLESAIGSLEKLNGIPAVNQLEAFLNQLDAAEKTDKLSSEDADTIEELVDDIIELIEDD